MLFWQVANFQTGKWPMVGWKRVILQPTAHEELGNCLREIESPSTVDLEVIYPSPKSCGNSIECIKMQALSLSAGRIFLRPHMFC